jgi:hypothetical protein
MPPSWPSSRTAEKGRPDDSRARISAIDTQRTNSAGMAADWDHCPTSRNHRARGVATPRRT